jgi:hypothetical protein
MSARRLSVDREGLSRRVLTVLALGILAAFSGALDARGDVVQTSKVRFVEHRPRYSRRPRGKASPSSPDQRRVVLLVVLEQQVLADARVSKYLNEHYVSVFADHDRPGSVRKYVRGLPMIVLSPGRPGPAVVAGVLKKDDFLSVVKQVAVALARAAGPLHSQSAPLSPNTYRRLRGILTFVGENLTPSTVIQLCDKYPRPRLSRICSATPGHWGSSLSIAVEKTLDGSSAPS